MMTPEYVTDMNQFYTNNEQKSHVGDEKINAAPTRNREHDAKKSLRGQKPTTKEKYLLSTISRITFIAVDHQSCDRCFRL